MRVLKLFRGSECLGEFFEDELRPLISKRQATVIRSRAGQTVGVLLVEDVYVKRSQRALDLRDLMGTKYHFLESLDGHKCWSLKNIGAVEAKLGCSLEADFKRVQLDCMAA